MSKPKIFLQDNDTNFNSALCSIRCWSHDVLGQELRIENKTEYVATNLWRLWQNTAKCNEIIEITFEDKEDYNLFMITFDSSIYQKYLIGELHD